MKTFAAKRSTPDVLAIVRRRSPLVLLVLLLVGGSAVLWRTLRPISEPVAAEAQGFPPIPVETATLAEGAAVQRVTLLGQVEAITTATVRSQTSGVIEAVRVEVGDRVTSGTVIATLSTADQQLSLAEAQARLAQERSDLTRLEAGTRPEIVARQQAELRSAQAREREAQDSLGRYVSLFEAGAISEIEIVEARAALDVVTAERLQAEATLAEANAGPLREEISAQQARVAAALAAVNQAQITLERTQVVATTSGMVQLRQVSVGDRVETNHPLITLVNGNALEVVLELPESLSGSISAGLPVDLTARALPNWQGRGTISGLVPSATAASRRQGMRVSLSNPPANLLPNMAIQAELTLPASADSFVVPRDALVRRGDQWLIYTVEGDTATAIAVQQVADMGETMAIAGDALQPGQPIVVRGGEALMGGAPVQVIAPQGN